MSVIGNCLLCIFTFSYLIYKQKCKRTLKKENRAFNFWFGNCSIISVKDKIISFLCNIRITAIWDNIQQQYTRDKYNKYIKQEIDCSSENGKQKILSRSIIYKLLKKGADTMEAICKILYTLAVGRDVNPLVM